MLTGPSHDALDRALAPGLIALAAYQAGGSEAVLDMSISYSNTREQFGQPIGRFQRVQDHIIRILNAADTARWTAYEAAWALDSGRPDAAAKAHLTSAVASEAYLEATNAAHEVARAASAAIRNWAWCCTPRPRAALRVPRPARLAPAADGRLAWTGRDNGLTGTVPAHPRRPSGLNTSRNPPGSSVTGLSRHARHYATFGMKRELR